MEENRRRRRVKYEYSVLSFNYKRGTSDRRVVERPLLVIINDISYSGLGLQINQKLGKGDKIYLNLTDGFDRMEFVINVEWCSGNGQICKSGASFCELTEDKIYLLDRIIKGNSKQIQRG